jgi:tetratricopeptide (TPR) repeat protein
MKIARFLFGKRIANLWIILGVVHFSFFISEAIGQTRGFYDSLDIARTLLNQGNIQTALELLETLEKDHPGEENLIRIKGQALYWSKDFEVMRAYFRKSLKTYPNLYWARLDYGRILYEMNEWNESQNILKESLKINPHEPETNQKLAELNYWKGGSPKKSYAYLNEILNPFPDNELANTLKKEIKTGTSPYLGLASGYFSDSQPLQYLNLSATGNFYQSAVFQPGFSAEFRSYSSGIALQIAQASNKFSIPKSNTSLLIRAGLAKSSVWESFAFTYGAEFSQKFPKNLELILSADQEAYFFTLASLADPIIPLTFRTSFGRETGKSWSGKISWQNTFFEDQNTVNTLGAWFLVPILKQAAIRIDFGYSLNFSNSKEVRFSEELPIRNTPKNTEIGAVIPGLYTPYFTPINQQVHGALGKVAINFSENIALSLTGNYGFLAKIENPNMIFFGSTDMNPNAPISNKDISLILVETAYTPLDFKAALNWEISSKSAFLLTYVYQETIFFDSHSINLNYNFRIWNDQ